MEDPGSQERRAANTRDISETIDALRSTLTEEHEQDTWRRDISIIGLVAAVFGVFAWYAILSEREGPLIARLQIDSKLTASSNWVGTGFEQAFAAYIQAGNRIRLVRQEPRLASGVVSAVASFSHAPVSAETENLIAVTLRHDGNNEQLIAVIELTTETIEERAVLQGKPDALSDMAARIALQIFDWLHIDPFSSAERSSALAEIPQAQQVAALYARGLASLLRGEGRNAVELISQALEEQPNHPMLNSALAEAYDFLGYGKQATQHIATAFENRQPLSREKQLSIEARLHLLNHDWPEAEKLFAALHAFYPSELSYGLGLALAQSKNSRMDAALATLAALRAQARFSSDAMIELTEAQIWRRAGDWQKGLSAAEKAIAYARARSRDGVLARALITAADLGSEQADEYLTHAYQIMRSLDDPFGTSQVWRERADRARAAGRLDQAEEGYNQALEISMRVGNDAEIDSARQALAIVYDLRGDLQAGYALKEKVLQSYRRREVHAGAAIMLENMGISLFKLGRLREAEQRFSDALAMFETHGDQIGIAWWPYHQGRIASAQGRFEDARALFERAFVNAQIHPEGELALHTRYELAKIDLFTGTAETSNQLRDLVAAYKEKELVLDAGDTLILLSRLEAGRGNNEEAMLLLADAERIFSESGANYYLAHALAFRVHAGDLSACETLKQQLAEMQHQPTQLLGRLAMHKCPGSTQDLPQIAAEAQKLALFEPHLAAIAQLDPETARLMAERHGWQLSGFP